MKTINNIKIIGVDAGYGNMKTANFCFRTGLTAYDTEPMFTKNMLVYEGCYYLIGEGHKTYTAEKTLDEDYYVLTLAAIAMELSREHLTEADVYLSAGLPLSWVLEQKDDYLAYLLKNQEVEFSFKGVRYKICIVGAGHSSPGVRRHCGQAGWSERDDIALRYWQRHHESHVSSGWGCHS